MTQACIRELILTCGMPLDGHVHVAHIYGLNPQKTVMGYRHRQAKVAKNSRYHFKTT